MVAPLNFNPSAAFADFDLLPPRQLGRGAAAKSTGAILSAGWNGTHVTAGGVNIFALAVAPLFLDIAYDTLDRAQFSWSEATGESYVYYYDALLLDYTIKLIGEGVEAFEPAICNDYGLEGGVNTVVAYLKNSVPTYRVQADRFGIEYTLVDRKARGIKGFGYGRKTNSIQIITGLWR